MKFFILTMSYKLALSCTCGVCHVYFAPLPMSHLNTACLAVDNACSSIVLHWLVLLVSSDVLPCKWCCLCCSRQHCCTLRVTYLVNPCHLRCSKKRRNHQWSSRKMSFLTSKSTKKTTCWNHQSCYWHPCWHCAKKSCPYKWLLEHTLLSTALV